LASVSAAPASRNGHFVCFRKADDGLTIGALHLNLVEFKLVALAEKKQPDRYSVAVGRPGFGEQTVLAN
jgi:hypothetical protein